LAAAPPAFAEARQWSLPPAAPRPLDRANPDLKLCPGVWSAKTPVRDTMLIRVEDLTGPEIRALL
jgi:hypothetical protein